MIRIQFKNKNDQFHRINGPASFISIGHCFWIKNSEYHREDGPAIIYANGEKYYYLNGKRYNKEKYYNQLK